MPSAPECLKKLELPSQPPISKQERSSGDHSTRFEDEDEDEDEDEGEEDEEEEAEPGAEEA
jgi:hypothetical protein